MLKVAITGPESTGKSTISEQLATHYQTLWVPEYARTYIGNMDKPYTLQDIEAIAKGQYELEQRISRKANGILFSDTDMLVLKIWSEHAFGKCPDFITEKLQQQNYNLYLLMGVDLPWEADPQREHPHLRDFFYDWYKQELQTMGALFVEIKGKEQERFIEARKQVDALLQEQK